MLLSLFALFLNGCNAVCFDDTRYGVAGQNTSETDAYESDASGFDITEAINNSSKSPEAADRAESTSLNDSSKSSESSSPALPGCHYNKETEMVDYTVLFDAIPESDDQTIYLYEFENFEDVSFDGKHPVAKAPIESEVTFSFPFMTKHLFSRFVPAVICDNEIHALSSGLYITNPETIARNTTEYPDIASKKGILLDPLTLDKDELTNLNVNRAVFNIPLSFIMGKTENDAIPTVNYEYMGKIYHFNGYRLAGFDSVFSYLTANNYHVTAIVLNDLNESYPELIHPMSRRKTSQSMYYAFNTAEKTGVRTMEAAALFLAERYSGGVYGCIQDWVIANEINQQKIWNYMATDNLDYYMESFEKSFRTFYNAIKSNYSNARIYYSIDQDWNNNGGANYIYFNGKEVIDSFNKFAKDGGDYDWSLSVHPYPSPLTNTRFWKKHYDKSENARVVTPMNLSVVTDYMRNEDLLDTNGNVRNIGITELGFSSRSGEKNQAAAFAYCYQIIEDNEYINSFLFNRQTDTPDSLESGLALGIYNPDYSPKYIADVFANIDTDSASDYISEMLEIIGANDLEEALSWAR